MSQILSDLISKRLIPPSFISYLEKHRINELFFDLTSYLCINTPPDPLLFLRNLLCRIEEKRDRTKVVLIGPDHLELSLLAHEISKITGVLPVSVQEKFPNQDISKYLEPLVGFLSSDLYETKGWIMYDFPRTGQEAKAMLLQGILPTHVFHIIPTPDKYNPNDFWNKTLYEKGVTAEQLRSMLKTYLNRMSDVLPLLAHNLRDMRVQGRNVTKLARECAKEMKKYKYGQNVPSVPKVVFMGVRGSRTRSLAKHVANRLSLVYLDMEILMATAGLKQNELGEQIRNLIKAEVPIHSKILIKVLKERLLQEDCLSKGWILRGFPRDRADLEVMDMFDTPPNRVIILSVCSTDCYNSVVKRRVNVITGELANIDDIKKVGDINYERLFQIHPFDHPDYVCKQHEDFGNSIKDIIDYCGDTAIFVDASGPHEVVVERVEKAIITPMPAVGPRLRKLPDAVCPPEIFADVVLEPDEDPTQDILKRHAAIADESRCSVLYFPKHIVNKHHPVIRLGTECTYYPIEDEHQPEEEVEATSQPSEAEAEGGVVKSLVL